MTFKLLFPGQTFHLNSRFAYQIAYSTPSNGCLIDVPNVTGLRFLTGEIPELSFWSLLHL